MSVAVTVPAYKTRLGNPSAKMVLVLLADAANSDGYAFPSFRYIAEQTEIAERTVRRVLQVFEAIGLLAKTVGPDSIHYVAYQINMTLLGSDLVAEYAEKMAVVRGTDEEIVPRTQNSVPRTQNVVPGTKPPHPLKGRTVIEPSVNRQGQKTSPSKAKSVQLPSWLERGAWEAYLAMRREIRRPATPRAQELVLSKLAEYHARGIPITEVLDQSVVNCWQDVYEPKGDRNGNGRGNGTGAGQYNRDAQNDEVLRGVLARQGFDLAGAGGDGVVPAGQPHAGVPRTVLQPIGERASGGRPRIAAKAG